MSHVIGVSRRKILNSTTFRATSSEGKAFTPKTENLSFTGETQRSALLPAEWSVSWRMSVRCNEMRVDEKCLTVLVKETVMGCEMIPRPLSDEQHDKETDMRPRTNNSHNLLCRRAK